MTKLDEFNKGFIKYHEFELIENTKEKVIIKAPLKDNALNPYGMSHGGFTFALGDTVMGIHCFTLGHQGVTLNSDINYLKPGKGEYLTAESELVKEGKQVSFFKANIYDDKHELIANMEATYYYK